MRVNTSDRRTCLQQQKCKDNRKWKLRVVGERRRVVGSQVRSGGRSKGARPTSGLHNNAEPWTLGLKTASQP